MIAQSNDTEDMLRQKIVRLEAELKQSEENRSYGWDTAKATEAELKKMLRERNSLKEERDRLVAAIAGETHLDGLTGEYARQATEAAEKAQGKLELTTRQRDYLIRELLRLGGEFSTLLGKNEHSL